MARYLRELADYAERMCVANERYLSGKRAPGKQCDACRKRKYRKQLKRRQEEWKQKLEEARKERDEYLSGGDGS